MAAIFKTPRLIEQIAFQSRLFAGHLEVDVVPCSAEGSESSTEDLEDVFVENPDELVGSRRDFLIRIKCGRGLPKQFAGLFCAFKWFGEEQESRTAVIDTPMNPDFNFERHVTVDPVTQSFIDYVNG